MPQSHDGDAHLIEFFERAVISCKWSHEQFSSVITNNISFQQLYGAPESFLHLHKEARLELEADNVFLQRESIKEDPFGVQLVAHGRYKNPSSSSQVKAVKSVGNLHAVSGCLNCDDPSSHFAKDFSKPRKFSKTATRMLNYYQQKKAANPVHVVLAELCHQLEKESEADAGENENTDIFHRLVSTLYSSNSVDKNVEILAVKERLG